MLEFATASSDSLDCKPSDYDWDELKRTLKRTDIVLRERRKDRVKKDQSLISEHTKRDQIISQLRDAIAVVISDDDDRAPKSLEAKRAGADVIMQGASHLGIANEVAGGWRAYSTRLRDEGLEPSGKPLTGELLDSLSDNRKYDPARMEADEDDTKYFARLKMQADPITGDSQLVLDVTGWVVARSTVEGANVTNHPITNDPVALPKRAHLLWPSAIRFQTIIDEPDKDYLVVDEYDREYKVKQDLLPCRQPVSGLPVCGEGDAYVMPEPIVDGNDRIHSEPNAKLRKLRKKRNFDLSVEMAKALYRRLDEHGDRMTVEERNKALDFIIKSGLTSMCK